MLLENPLELVREFHQVYGLPIAEKPGHPDREQVALRYDLLDEEFTEYAAAVAAGDLVEIADALADIIYIVCGTALVYGIPLDEIFDEVHRSNMSKLDDEGNPIYRSDGKVLKGPAFSPPDITRILKRHETIS